MSMPRAATIANVLGYQCAWWSCVASAAADRPALGMAASAAFALATLALGGRWREDLRTLAIALPLGFGMDSAFAASGWLVYAAGPWSPLAPGWIAAIWVAFAMTLNHSLAFLRSHLPIAAVLGLLGAPLAYSTAARGFGVLAFADPAPQVLVALALAWALLLPLVLVVDARAPRRAGFA